MTSEKEEDARQRLLLGLVYVLYSLKPAGKLPQMWYGLPEKRVKIILVMFLFANQVTKYFFVGKELLNILPY